MRSLKKISAFLLLLLVTGCAAGSSLPAEPEPGDELEYASIQTMPPMQTRLIIRADHSAQLAFTDSNITVLVSYLSPADSFDLLYQSLLENGFSQIGTYKQQTLDRGGTKVVYSSNGKTIQVADMGSTYVKKVGLTQYQKITTAFQSSLACLENSDIRQLHLEWTDEVKANDIFVELDLKENYAGILDQGNNSLTVCLAKPGISFPITIKTNGDSILTKQLDSSQTGGVSLQWNTNQLSISEKSR